MRRFLRWAAAAFAVLALLAGAGIGWYYAGEILVPEPAADEPSPPSDPRLRPVRIQGPLGAYPALHAAAAGGPYEDVWAIHVHGRGAEARSCTALLPTLLRLRIDTLCTSYRNDPGAPPDPRGFYRQGDQEWKDVAAALDYARDRGARRIVLIGDSMGGQITATLLRTLGPPDVVAVIWDSPLLDWGPAIRLGAVDRDVPTWLVPLGMTASEMRADVDYAELNHNLHANEFDVPILLLHGTADATVPVEVSDRFARQRPDLVTYVRVDGIEHVDLRNAQPQRYDAAVTTFLIDSLEPAASGALVGEG